MRALWQSTIWAEGAVRDDDETRNYKRIWIFGWLGFALWSGLNAILYGSRLLDRLYGPTTDVLGSIYILVALAAVIGAAFPRLWALAGAAALLLIGMNAAYIWGIVSSPSAEQLAAKEAPNWFIVTQLCGTLIALYFWIEVLITDLVKRRADERRQQAVDLGE